MLKKNPLVSIITVCFNAEKTIEQTIQSVLAQTYPDIEYILVDGLSQDRTVDIIRRYVGQINNPCRMRYISEKDRGIYDAMNKGIHMANGQLVGIVNADDWYEDDAVENMVKAYISQLDKDNTLYYGMLRIWRDNKEFCVRQYHHNFVTETVIQHPTNFVPKALYNRVGVFDATLRIAADFELLNRFRVNGVNFCKVDKVISNFRLGGASDHMTTEQLLETPRIQLRYGIITPERFRQIEDSYRKVGLWKRIKRAVKYVLFG